VRGPNPELERRIRQAGLALLLEKEPEEIGMREIAGACGVSATTIYYYHADKDSLFDAIKLDCIAEMDEYIRSRADTEGTALARIRIGYRAFRDWCFAHPRIALLIMGRLKPNRSPRAEIQEPYYRSNEYARRQLEKAVAEGSFSCADTRLANALHVAAVWGAIESVLLNRTDPEYWDKGVYFTDNMIDLLIPAEAGKDVP
jgi:AcrR family transcriptional regulator